MSRDKQLIAYRLYEWDVPLVAASVRRDWMSATPNGGALHIIENNGQCTKIEVTFNSLVVFDVTKHKKHYVADIQATAGNQSRLTIGGWFRKPAQA